MRSLLFVPGHDPRKLAKGLGCGADALIVDLEDAVPDSEKVRARGICSEFVQAHRERLPLLVRVNALSTGLTLDDLVAVVRARPFAIMLPKCESGRDVALVSTYLAALEAREGIEVGSLRILPIVTETAAALFDMGSYAKDADGRLCGLMWGGEDLAADIGAIGNRDAQSRYTLPFALARSLTLLAATAAGVPAIDAVFTDYRSTESLQAESIEALRDGFSAKAAIHPDQVGPINAAFTPSSGAVAWATRVAQAFDASPDVAVVSIDGKMLDRPHYRSARRVLARAH